MKVLFVNPSLRPDAPHRYLPVGLGYVLTAARDAGFDVHLLDVDIGRLSDSEVDRHFAHNHYDVVAVGSIVTHYRWIKWLIGTVKRHQPGCKVVVGNSVGSSIPEILFAKTEVDVVVLGEGDVTIVELLQALNEGRPLGQVLIPTAAVEHSNGPYPGTVRGRGIEGIVFRDATGRVVNNGLRTARKKIDEFPFPDWDLFDVQSYLAAAQMTAHDTPSFSKEQAVVMPINTARGCVFKCTFCHYVFWNDPYRHRSADNIVGEIRRNKEKYGANYFNFWDELSFHKLGPAEQFADALIAADLGVHWTAAVRSDLFGRTDIPYEDRLRVAEKAKRAGAIAMGYSLESANAEILEAMNKRVKSEYFAEQVALLREVGIISNTSLVFGYPQETPATIAETMQMCIDVGVYPSPGFLLPLPATGMWKHALAHGHITDPHQFLVDVTERQDVVMNMTTMSNEQLQAEVTGWLARASDALALGLSSDSLIRTSGYAKHGKNQERAVLAHRDTVDTLNYAAKAGAV